MYVDDALLNTITVAMTNYNTNDIQPIIKSAAGLIIGQEQDQESGAPSSYMGYN